METVIIRKVSISDIGQLQKIGRKTFSETFSDQNTEENMKKYLEEGFSIKKLTEELSDNNSEFYFATLKNEVIGYLKLNLGEAQKELKNAKSIEIERIYVSKEYQGKSVGQLLFNKSIEIAHNHNAEFVWLGVWEENPKAIRFYKKNGFVEFEKRLFKLGDDIQTDLMMKLPLHQNPIVQ